MRLQRRGWRTGLLVLVTGTMFAVAGSCVQMTGSALLAGLDPCAVLDCTGGIFGGAFNPCGTLGDPTDDVFVKCP